ncbi:MAG TPA: 6-phosphofructokinase, partial [Thermoleophilia bacterium]|nr:6-phosphofructokinase [Thermoleophilia bacterium]
NSGATSLYSAYLAGADRAVIPEVPFDVEKLAGLLAADREANPSHYSIMTISEGAVPAGGGGAVESGEADAFGHKKLGGIGQAVTAELKRLTGVNMMFQQLGYVIRSGPPDVLDRMVATSYGTLALDQLAAGKSGILVALQGGRYTTLDLTVVAGGQRPLDIDAFYDSEQYRPRVADVLGKPMFMY